MTGYFIKLKRIKEVGCEFYRFGGNRLLFALVLFWGSLLLQ